MSTIWAIVPTIYIHKSGESEINELVSSELLKDFFISFFSVPMFFSPPKLSLNFGQRCFIGEKENFCHDEMSFKVRK